MPSPVDKYFKEVKDKNPTYSDEQAWATAWSIYCKSVNPGSSSCHKPTSEYLKGKESSMNPLRQFEDSLVVIRVVSRFAAKKKPFRTKDPKPKFELGDKVRDKGDPERVGEVSYLGEYDKGIGGYRYKVKEPNGQRKYWSEPSMEKDK